jgi:hypothetical protein
MTPTEIAALVGGVSTGVSGVGFFLVLLFAEQSRKSDKGHIPSQQLRAILGGILALIALGAFCAVCVGQTYKSDRGDDTTVIWGEYIAAATSIVLPMTLCLSLFKGLGGRLACPGLALVAFGFETLGILMPSFGNFLFTIFAGICFLLAILALFWGEQLEVSRKRTKDGDYPSPVWRVGTALQLAIGFVLFILDTGVFDVYNGSHIVPTILWVVYVFGSFIGAFLLLFLSDAAPYDRTGVGDGGAESERLSESSINGRSLESASAPIANGISTLTSRDGRKYSPI